MGDDSVSPCPQFDRRGDGTQVMERPPWVLAPASALFVVALIVFRNLGKAVGVSLVYSGGAMMVRFRREPPDLLKALAPGWYGLREGPQPATVPPWPWQVASLLIGLLLIGLGVTFFVLASGS